MKFDLWYFRELQVSLAEIHGTFESENNLV